MQNLLPALIAAIFGAGLGSFATMLIWRLHHDEGGIFFGRSKCPRCRKELKVTELIPLFSWMRQRGQCTHCCEKIPLFYPVVELTFIVVYFLFVQKFYLTQGFWLLAIALFFVLVLFFYDARFSEVDRRISWPAIVLAAILAISRDGNFINFAIGGGLGFLFYFVQYFYSKKYLKTQWVGAGDMELGALMGLLLGWELLILALFFRVN